MSATIFARTKTKVFRKATTTPKRPPYINQFPKKGLAKKVSKVSALSDKFFTKNKRACIEFLSENENFQ